MDIRCFRPRSGIDVSYENPRPEMFDPRDIAWALGRLPRFLGHTSAAVPLSVAQHSIAVADEACRLFQEGRPVPWSLSEVAVCRLVALLHDASEAYTGDIPTPLKRYLGPRLLLVEAKFGEALWERFGCDLGEESRFPHGLYFQALQAVQAADEACLVEEMSTLLGDVPPELRDVAPCGHYADLTRPWSASLATVEYYGDLRRAVNAATGVDLGDLVPDGGSLDPMPQAFDSKPSTPARFG